MSEKNQFQTHPLIPPSSSPAASHVPFVPTSSGPDPFDLASDAKIVALRPIRKRLARFVAPVIALLLIGAIAYIWFAPVSSSPASSSPPGISQQSFGNAP